MRTAWDEILLGTYASGYVYHRYQAPYENSSRVSCQATEKDEPVSELNESTALLGGSLGIDSLDLAVLLMHARV